MKQESPGYVRLSQAAAMVLGFKTGLFYRNAKSPCINVLLTYDSGCVGNCAYCGLSMKRPGTYTKKSFIRVEWSIYRLDEVTQRISQKIYQVKRICISMITNKRAVKDAMVVAKRLKESQDIPVSLLISPTIVNKKDLINFKECGADRIGIAIDTATPQLFEELRGKGVNGPHEWQRYWDCLSEAVEVFGRGKVGVHLIVGLGEREDEMLKTIQTAHNMGIDTHLFSFFPETDSILASHPQAPAGNYRRIQLARYLINKNMASLIDFSFDNAGRLTSFGLHSEKLDQIIESGKPFMTSGCPDKDGEVACNRPYSDSLPGPDIRNFPFILEIDEVLKIKRELQTY